MLLESTINFPENFWPQYSTNKYQVKVVLEKKTKKCAVLYMVANVRHLNR